MPSSGPVVEFRIAPSSDAHRIRRFDSSFRRLCLLGTFLVLGLVFAPGSISAAPTKQKIGAAVNRGAGFLLEEGPVGKHATPGLAAYALIKAGQSPDHPAIVKILERIVKKTEGGEYVPRFQQLYEAGVDIMALEAAMHEMEDSKQYLPEIKIIVQYILKHQAPAGSWFYPSQRDNGGDTSITQYALLGLWAASRAGVKISPGVWDRCAAWHIRTQRYDGAFLYHPGGVSVGYSRHSMTVNGVASLCIARMLLYPKGDRSLPQIPDVSYEEYVSAVSALGQGRPSIQYLRYVIRNRDGESPESKPSPDDDEPPLGNDATPTTNDGDSDAGSQENPEVPAPGNEKPKRKFGILVPVDVATGKRFNEDVAKPKAPASPGRVQTSLANINFSIALGVKYLTKRFTIDKPEKGWYLYYLYGLERMSALAEIEDYGGRRWYDEGAEFLLTKQAMDGSFYGRHSTAAGTSFALLFLTNATKNLINPDGTPRVVIGGGLLIGNRGLPDNLSEINMTEEGVKPRKLAGPIDELLAELENPKSLNIAAAQSAIVEKIQIGDREGLIGQRERLLRLVEDPRVEVRRVALWALARCAELDDAAVFIRSLEDRDVSVAVESNNALCWLSRRPDGVGIPSNPIASLPEDASEEQKLAAVSKWRKALVKKWGIWFADIQPYRNRELIPAPRLQ